MKKRLMVILMAVTMLISVAGCSTEAEREDLINE